MFTESRAQPIRADRHSHSASTKRKSFSMLGSLPRLMDLANTPSCLAGPHLSLVNLSTSSRSPNSIKPRYMRFNTRETTNGPVPSCSGIRSFYAPSERPLKDGIRLVQTEPICPSPPNSVSMGPLIQPTLVTIFGRSESSTPSSS
jgi:hypothetical protein